MKRLLILSGKGGTGKTTAAAAFLHFSQAKAAADCDVDAPNLHLLHSREDTPAVSPFYGGDKAEIDPKKCVGCGLCQSRCRFGAIEEQGGVFAVNEFACEGCGVCGYVCPEQAVSLRQDTAGQKALYSGGGSVFSTAALKMGRGNSGKLVTEVKLAMLKQAPETELAILDGSPGIGCPVIASVSGMDLVLVVAEPSLSGLSDLKRLVKTAQTLGARLAVCVNKWDVSPQQTAQIQAFCEEAQLPFVGKIPYDPQVSKAINQGRSAAQEDCPAREALQTVYENTIQLLKE